MKRNLFAGIAGLGLTIAMTANGQVASNNVQFSKTFSYAKSFSNDVEPNFNRNVARDLSKNFVNVSGASWVTLPDGYFVRFMLDDIDQIIFYDKKGNRLYTMRNYDEKRLPEDIRHLVKSSYYDYDIRLVQEIESTSKAITYIIHLEGKSKWINVRIADGEMDEFEKYNKAE